MSTLSTKSRVPPGRGILCFLRPYMSASVFCGPIAALQQVATHKPLLNKKICSGGQMFEKSKIVEICKSLKIRRLKGND